MGYELHIKVFFRLKGFIKVEKWSIIFCIFKHDEPLLKKLELREKIIITR